MNIPFVNNDENAPRQQVSPLLIALVAIALIGFIVWRAWAAFAGPVAGPLPPPPTQDINYLHDKAKESQGDFNRLSPEDQTKVNQITHGFGPATMASEWRKASNPTP